MTRSSDAAHRAQQHVEQRRFSRVHRAADDDVCSGVDAADQVIAQAPGQHVALDQVFHVSEAARKLSDRDDRAVRAQVIEDGAQARPVAHQTVGQHRLDDRALDVQAPAGGAISRRTRSPISALSRNRNSLTRCFEPSVIHRWVRSGPTTPTSWTFGSSR